MQLKDLWAQVYSDPLDLWVLWPEETDEEASSSHEEDEEDEEDEEASNDRCREKS